MIKKSIPGLRPEMLWRRLLCGTAKRSVLTLCLGWGQLADVDYVGGCVIHISKQILSLFKVLCALTILSVHRHI